MNALDAHVHVIVPEIARGAGGPESWRPWVRREAGRQLIDFGGLTIASALGEFVDIEAILTDRARRGIERVLVCPWVNLLFSDLAAEVALERLRAQNAGLIAMRDRHPDRVAVLGAVPLADPELAAAELEALMASGCVAGIEVTASVGGVYLGDPRFEPLWEVAEASGALVFVHPTTRGFDASVFGEHYLWNLVGNPFETTITAAHMALGGVLHRHPRLQVLLAHGGGALLALRGRLRHGQGSVAAARTDSGEPLDATLARFFYDTVVHDPAVLRELVAAVGAGQVLLGSDHPFDMADPDPVATVRAAGLGPEAEQAVLAGNADRLLAGVLAHA